MTNTDKPSLREFCKQYAAEHPETGRKSDASDMWDAALRAKYVCTQSTINSIRSLDGLSRKSAPKSQNAHGGKSALASKPKRGRRRRYATKAAAAAAKYAANRVRRQLKAQKPISAAPAVKVASIVEGKTSPTERAFLDAIAQVGLERAKGLIARFEKLSGS